MCFTKTPFFLNLHILNGNCGNCRNTHFFLLLVVHPVLRDKQEAGKDKASKTGMSCHTTKAHYPQSPQLNIVLIRHFTYLQRASSHCSPDIRATSLSLQDRRTVKEVYTVGFRSLKILLMAYRHEINTPKRRLIELFTFLMSSRFVFRSCLKTLRWFMKK